MPAGCGQQTELLPETNDITGVDGVQKRPDLVTCERRTLLISFDEKRGVGISKADSLLLVLLKVFYCVFYGGKIRFIPVNRSESFLSELHASIRHSTYGAGWLDFIKVWNMINQRAALAV